MKNAILFLLILGLALPARGQSVLPSINDLKRQPNDQGVDVHYYQGRPFSGKTYDYFEHEDFAREHHLKDGLLSLREGYRHGKKVEYAEYKDGMLDGAFIHYFGNGQKYIEHHYRQGRMHGKQYGWEEDGTVRFVADYRDGIELMRISYPPPGGFETLIRH